MKLLLKSLFYASAASVLWSCASAKAETDAHMAYKREMSITQTFTGLQATAGIEIVYTESDRVPKAVITGEKRVVEDLKATIADGILCFENSDNVKREGKLTVTLNGPRLSTLEAFSEGKLTVTTPVTTTGDLNVRAFSSGKLSFRAPVTVGGMLDVQASSYGKVSFDGSVKVKGLSGFSVASMGSVACKQFEAADTRLSVASIGKIGMGTVKCGDITIAAASSADVTVDDLIATDINLMAASTGDIKIGKCTGADVNVSAASSAEVEVKGATLGDLRCQASSTAKVVMAGKAAGGTFQASSMGHIDISGMKFTTNPQVSQSSLGEVRR